MFPPRGQSQTHARAEEAEQCFLGGEEETHRPTGMERLADSDNDDGRWAWPLSMRVFLSFLRRQRQTAEPRTKDKREAEEGGTGGGFQASPAAKPPTPVFPCVFSLCPSPPPPPKTTTGHQNHHLPLPFFVADKDGRVLLMWRRAHPFCVLCFWGEAQIGQNLQNTHLLPGARERSLSPPFCQNQKKQKRCQKPPCTLFDCCCHSSRHPRTVAQFPPPHAHTTDPGFLFLTREH